MTINVSDVHNEVVMASLFLVLTLYCEFYDHIVSSKTQFVYDLVWAFIFEIKKAFILTDYTNDLAKALLPFSSNIKMCFI